MKIDKAHTIIMACIILMAIAGFLIAAGCGYYYAKGQHECKQCKPFDIYQLQTFLVQCGFKLKIDGICGKATHEARDKYWANQYAERSMTSSGKPEKN